MKIQNPFVTGLIASSFAVLHAGTGSKQPIIQQSAREKHWEVHASFGIRQAFDFKFRSNSTDLLGAAFSPEAAGNALFAGIGPADAEADRLYDDGFVNIGSAYNLTTHWGYDDASQVTQSSTQWDPSQPWDSPGNQSLYLTRTGEVNIAGYGSKANSDRELFPYIEARRWWESEPDCYWREKGLVVSWSWIPADAGLNQNLLVRRDLVVDEYYLYGIIPPAAPYEGPESPPGPLLDNIPNDRQYEDGSSDFTGTTRSHVSLDMHTLSIGGILRHHRRQVDRSGAFPSLYGLDLHGGLALNYAKLKLTSHTTVSDADSVIGSFSRSASKSRMMPGLYLSAGATFDIGEDEDWMIFSQCRYDYAGRIKVKAGASSAEVDLRGLSFMIGVGRRW